MQLKQTTDYSIRVLLYLATRQRNVPVPGSEIAREIGISPAYLSKVVSILKDKALLRSDQGSRGGFSLAQAPAAITLYQVIAACEGVVALNRGQEDTETCSRNAASWYKVHSCLDQVQDTLNKELESFTLADLI